MPLASFSERRARLRAVIARGDVTSPGSVFDPLSTRLAQMAGYEYGLIGGSIASHEVLAAPDLMVLTLTELVDQMRRMGRACDLPLVVDADHGYGNALNARRTIEELEAAGLAGLTIEDTVLPRSYGSARNDYNTPDEFRDKLRACLDARSDPGLVIVGRLMHRGDREDTLRRVQACIDAGTDMIFVNGRVDLELLDAVHSATQIPLIVSRVTVAREDLQERGVRILYQGHEPFFVALKALSQAYADLFAGAQPSELRDRALTPDQRNHLFDSAEYARLQSEYLRITPEGRE
jgi:carboxyvinyl-carboxyphosphonate phosphorylmutase